MTSKDRKRKEQIGMPHTTARQRLQKAIIFNMLCKLNDNICYRCGKYITDIEDLSIDHKIPWLYSEDPPRLFFDLDNIAFSHSLCNSKAARTQVIRRNDEQLNT